MLNDKTLLTLLTFFFLACQQPAQPVPETGKEVLSLEDSLYKAVIGLHDEVMPKMGKIKGYEKIVQAKIDSLDKVLMHQKNEVGHDLRVKYQTLLDQLKVAEAGMNNWMDSFEPDPKLPSKKEMEAYWQDEYNKTRKMRDNFKAALDSAAVRLKH